MYVGFVPQAHSCTAANIDAIRSPRPRGRAGSAAVEAERLGGLEVDYQFEPSRLLNGEVRWQFTFENFIQVVRHAASGVEHARAIRHETTSDNEIARFGDGGELVLERELRNEGPVVRDKGLDGSINSISRRSLAIAAKVSSRSPGRLTG